MAKIFELTVPTWKVCIRSARYEIYHFKAIPRFPKRSRVSSRSSDPPYHKLKNSKPLHLNLIRQVRSHGFSAQYSSRCYCGRWRPQFPLNGMLCKLIERQAVNCASQCSWKRTATSRSIVFDMKLKLDVGLYLFKSSWSKLGFFSVGLTRACSWDAGKITCVNDTLHMFVIVCAREELTCFTSQVSIKSKEQCFTGDSAMNLAILAGVTGPSAF